MIKLQTHFKECVSKYVLRRFHVDCFAQLSARDLICHESHLTLVHYYIIQPICQLANLIINRVRQIPFQIAFSQAVCGIDKHTHWNDDHSK